LTFGPSATPATTATQTTSTLIQVTSGDVLTVTVGAGGSAGAGGGSGTAGPTGSAGQVIIAWTGSEQ
jgi:hypothetical protein